MKKLLLLIILLLLVSCGGKQDYRIKTGLQYNNGISGFKQDSKIQAELQDNKEFNKTQLVKIIKEKCGDKDFDVSEISTKEGKEIYLTCNYDNASLTYNGNNEYILSINGSRINPKYSIYFKNGKITKEGYNICGKWFKTMDDFYNLTGKLVVGNILGNDCKFIDITSGFKYTGYYYNGKFLNNIDSINGIDRKITWAFYINDNKNKKFLCYNKAYNKNKNLCDSFDGKLSFKFIIKKFNKGILLYTDKGEILKIIGTPDINGSWFGSYKTFLNGKEVK